MAYNAEVLVAFEKSLPIPEDVQKLLNEFPHKRENSIGIYYHADSLDWIDDRFNELQDFIGDLNDDAYEKFAAIEVGENETFEKWGDCEKFQVDWYSEIQSPFKWDEPKPADPLILVEAMQAAINKLAEYKTYITLTKLKNNLQKALDQYHGEPIFENDLLDLNAKLNPTPPDEPVKQLPYYEQPGNSQFHHLYRLNAEEYGAPLPAVGKTRIIADHRNVATLMEVGSNRIIVTFDLDKFHDNGLSRLLILLNSLEGDLVRYHELTKSGSSMLTRLTEREILQHIEHKYASLRKYLL